MYDVDLAEFSEIEETVAALYQKKVVVVQQPVKKKVSTGKVNTSSTISSKKVALNINLIRPVSGTITSRFGAVSSRRVSKHTGLDICLEI